MNQTTQYIFLGVAVVLLVIAGFQAVQIHSLEERFDTPTAQVSAPVANNQPVAQPQAAPTMVGGC